MTAGANTKSVAFVIAGNGLGHLKRTARVWKELYARHPNIRATFYCPTWQEEICWEHVGIDESVRVCPTRLSIGWRSTPIHLDRDLVETAKSVEAIDFASFDLVVSDNLVEPIAHAPQTVLMGSFLWHDVLRQAFPDDPSVKTYYTTMTGLLERHRVSMLCNEYFAMPAVEEWTTVTKIGLIPHVVPMPAITKQKGPLNVLIATGSSPAASDALAQVLRALRNSGTTNTLVHVDRRWVNRVRQEGLSAVDFPFSDFADLDAAFIRPGMGSISDCIAARVPMVVVPDGNPEIRFNAEKLIAAGVAVPLDSCVEILDNEAERHNIRERMKPFSLSGAVDAAQALVGMLEEPHRLRDVNRCR